MSKLRKLFLLLFLLAAAACLPGSGELARPTLDPTLQVCRAPSDCALGLRIDQCCTCPEAVTFAQLEADPSLVLYEYGRDYRPLQPQTCSDAVCGPCPPLTEGLYCTDGVCTRADREP